MAEVDLSKFNSSEFRSSQITGDKTCFSNGTFIESSSIHQSFIEHSTFYHNHRNICTIKFSVEETNVLQISTTNTDTGHSGRVKFSSLQNTPTKISTTQIRPTQIGISQINLVKISTQQTNTSQISATQIDLLQNNSCKVTLPSSISSQELFSSNVTHNQTSEILNNIQFSATNIWQNLLQPSTPIDITFQITDLPKGQLAEAQITSFGDNGQPNAGTILIDHNANDVGWFIDSTPEENSEFRMQNSEFSYNATPNSEAYGKYDLLTTVLHEIAHLYGFMEGYSNFDKYKQNSPLAFNGEHLDSHEHPDDLLNTHLAPGIRKLPSETDVAILQALLLDTETNKNNSLTPNAFLTSAPLIGIYNGTFDTQEGWQKRGSAQIFNGQALLSEQSPFLSNFSQTFTIPEGATSLQFTFLDTNLIPPTPLGKGGSRGVAPPDAVEVALLDSTTNTNLLPTIGDISNTDSFLNLQSNGTAYFSEYVNNIDTQINLNNQRTYSVDISNIPVGTEATLYFDLLGFGAKDSQLIIDDVRIITNNQTPPTATDDNIEINQGELISIPVLINDSNDVNPSKIEIINNPNNGTITINNNGTINYVSESDFIGIDNFSYAVQNNEGIISNPASVNIVVNNTPPTITELTFDTEINEGEETNFSVSATDNNDDDLTYTWDFGDGSSVISEQSSEIGHTYDDNGTYAVTLTVSDLDGGETTETLDVTVNNVVPVINSLTGDTNINEGDIANFTAQAIDSGNDTLIYTWNFGDESETVTGQNVTHQFANNGVYTVTLTVTDGDGGESTDTLEVTVNNVAPVISELTGDTNINEGDVANFEAIANDSGNDTLTYTWNFGDETELITGQNVTHQFANNGVYTVTLTVTDGDGGETTETLEVTVNNVAPVISELIGDTNINEGDVANFNAEAIDSGNDTLTYTWDFGDESELVIGQNVTHTFTNNGTYTVTLTVTDGDGGETTDTLEVIVNNVAPVITNLTGDTNTNEGDIANFEAIATDAGNDTLTYTWDFGDGSEPTIGNSVTHTYTNAGIYTVTLTVTDTEGATTTNISQITVNESIQPNQYPLPFGITAEGRVTINGNSDFDGNPLNLDDDTFIHAGKGFTFNGQPILPILRDSNGNPILNAAGKPILLDNAVTVAPNYSGLNAPNNNYGNLIPPQVIEPQILNIPDFNDIKTKELASKLNEGATAITLNPYAVNLNNKKAWSANFPAPGTPENPTLVRVTGGLNVPNGVDLSNSVIIVENGYLNFNGSNHILNNTVLIVENGGVNLANVNAQNLTVLSAHSLNVNGGATFKGTNLLATRESWATIAFNGNTNANGTNNTLTAISQGSITVNATSNTQGIFLAGGDFSFNGNSTLVGGIGASGNITLNGKTTITAGSFTHPIFEG